MASLNIEQTDWITVKSTETLSFSKSGLLIQLKTFSSLQNIQLFLSPRTTGTLIFHLKLFSDKATVYSLNYKIVSAFYALIHNNPKFAYET